MNLSISEEEKNKLLNTLSIANVKFQKTYPGDKAERQAVHTVYGGANLFKSNTCLKMGEVALKNLQTYAPDFIALAKVLKFKGYEDLPSSDKKIKKLIKKLDGLSAVEGKEQPAWLSYAIYKKIIDKLTTEPVEE